MKAIVHNLRRAILLLFDLVPTSVARHETYRSVRRRLSQTPERFAVKPTVRPFTPGAWRERSLAGPETDLVIDGFPGSANSWVANAIRRAVERPVRIESHFHYTVQLRRAVAYGVPAVVLLREPRAACDSLKSKEPHTWDVLIVLHWLHYYRWVARHQSTLIVVRFEDAIRDVDGLRRSVPAVGHLCARMLRGDALSRRASKTRAHLDRSRPWTRWLLARANNQYGPLWSTAVTWAAPDTAEDSTEPPTQGTGADSHPPVTRPAPAPVGGSRQ
jgi:hypothetical protein